MFGIGPMELIVIAVIAMVFIGPDKLPDLMKKFGRFFVQMRRHANDVKSSFNEVIHDAERELELERIRELQKKIQASSPTQVLEAAISEQSSEQKPLFGPGLDADGHPLPGYDENGFPLPKDQPGEAVSRDTHHQEYHEGHYVEGKFEKNADSFLAWDQAMDKPLSELFPIKSPQEGAATEATKSTTLPENKPQPSSQVPDAMPKASDSPQQLTESSESKHAKKPEQT